MANSGGGMIVYGVEEKQKSATGRKDTGKFDEGHERAYRSAAVAAISPPVFGLEIFRLGSECRAVAVNVPASVDGPHLIYKNDFFGAPVRNDADTAWMKERQIETMYRARFDERRRATDAVDSLFSEAAVGLDASARAWLVAVAHPRIARVANRPDRHQAREMFENAGAVALSYSNRNGVHPLENVDCLNPRPGLRRWTAVNTAVSDSSKWREAWASIHHDGSVTVTAAVGGHRKSFDGFFDGWEVEGRGIEASIADFMALVRAAAGALHTDEYEVRVGVEWTGVQPLSILTMDGSGWTFDGVSTPLRAFTSVRSTVIASGSAPSFHRQVHELAEDCVNQGGITYLHVISDPPSEEVTV